MQLFVYNRGENSIKKGAGEPKPTPLLLYQSHHQGCDGELYYGGVEERITIFHES